MLAICLFMCSQHEHVHLFPVLQHLIPTFSLEQCVQASARSTWSFTAAWTQWKRCWSKSTPMFPLGVNLDEVASLFPERDDLILSLPWRPPQSLRPDVTSVFCFSRISCLLQKVEDTVENLEAELDALLDVIEDPGWRPLLDNRGIAVDVLEDPAKRGLFRK